MYIEASFYCASFVSLIISVWPFKDASRSAEPIQFDFLNATSMLYITLTFLGIITTWRTRLSVKGDMRVRDARSRSQKSGRAPAPPPSRFPNQQHCLLLVTKLKLAALRCVCVRRGPSRSKSASSILKRAKDAISGLCVSSVEGRSRRVPACGADDDGSLPLCLCAKVRNSAPDKRADNAQHRAAVTGSGNGARRGDGGHSRRMAWIRGKILTWVARIFAESRNLRETALRGPGNT